MIFREAQVIDIPQIQFVRHSVKENVLSDPAMVTDEDCKEFITVRGKGWVCEIEDKLAGFSIIDVNENNIWALFVHPQYEGRGIGGRLHNSMLEWYFNRSQKKLWLGTEPNTKAEKFYIKKGWKEVGIHGKGEIKFEMTFEEWENYHKHTKTLSNPKS